MCQHGLADCAGQRHARAPAPPIGSPPRAPRSAWARYSWMTAPYRPPAGRSAPECGIFGMMLELESTRKTIPECARAPNTVKRRHLPRRTPPTTRYRGSPDPFDAEVLAEIGPPSAIAQNEFSARLRPHRSPPKADSISARASEIHLRPCSQPRAAGAPCEKSPARAGLV
jgi:hypothetical protein